MNTAQAVILIFTFAVGVAGIVWLCWSPIVHHDETTHCQKCGCGMVEVSNGWQCPECRNLVECEREETPNTEKQTPKVCRCDICQP